MNVFIDNQKNLGVIIKAVNIFYRVDLNAFNVHECI